VKALNIVMDPDSSVIFM